MNAPTQAQIRQLLDYDQGTGIFTWKVDRHHRPLAGKKAGHINGDGYVEITVAGRSIKAHRLAVLLVAGAYPRDEVDHIDGDRTNNRFANLRCVSRADNQKNRKRHSTNRSGYKGVSWKAQNSRWVASINIGGKRIHLGYFDTAEDARDAYEIAAERLHGSYRRRNP